MPITHTNIKEVVTSYDNYKDEIVIMEFDNITSGKLKRLAPLTPARYDDALILVGITDGEMDIQIDYITDLFSNKCLSGIFVGSGFVFERKKFLKGKYDNTKQCHEYKYPGHAYAHYFQCGVKRFVYFHHYKL